MSPAPGLPRDPYTFAVLCRELQLERLIRQSLPPSSHLAIFAGWPEFEHAAARADCAIAVVPWLDEAAAISGLRALKQRAQDVPLILVTHSDPANSRLLKDVKVDDVVWINEVRPRLTATIEKLSGATFLSKVAREAERASHLPPIVRELIAMACRHEGTLPTETVVARALGVSRTTLWREWQKTAPENVRLEDFFDWLLLLRAFARRWAAKSWAAAARELGSARADSRPLSTAAHGASLEGAGDPVDGGTLRGV